jgi:hypothetical protein
MLSKTAVELPFENSLSQSLNISKLWVVTNGRNLPSCIVGQSCMQGIQDGRLVLSCDVNSKSQLLAHSLQVDIALSFQLLLKNVESQVSWYEFFIFSGLVLS